MKINTLTFENKDMNKEEAMAAMQTGQKVTHPHFMPHEWITMKDDLIITEEGYETLASEFWTYRRSVAWLNDWSVFKD